jgi:hypothetical protein
MQNTHAPAQYGRVRRALRKSRYLFCFAIKLAQIAQTYLRWNPLKDFGLGRMTIRRNVIPLYLLV